MGKRSEKYSTYCENVHDLCVRLIETATEAKLSTWLQNQTIITEYEQKRAAVIDEANAVVRRIDPNLKATGPLQHKSTLRWQPQWVADIMPKSGYSDPVVWYSRYDRLYHIFTLTFEHKPMLKVEGGVFRPLMEHHNLQYLCEDNDDDMPVTLTDPSHLIVLDEASRHAVRWAETQFKLLYVELNEWTRQFKEYSAKRAIDLSFYFSPVFASFATGPGAKVFRQRPRIDAYIPMSNELATLLTMARASNHYNQHAYAFRV